MALDVPTGSNESKSRASTRGIVPCLWFDDQAEQAANFYASTFSEGCIHNMTRYPENAENPSGRPPGSVLSVDFGVHGARFSAINGGPHFQITPSISFFVELGDATDAEQLFGALADGGEVMMPFDSYPWSENYGWVQDRFGTSWQVMTVDQISDAGPIYPCLLFSDAQEGRGEEAMRYYVDVFADASIDSIEHYGADEGPEDYVKHGRIVIDGHQMVITDSHIEHGFEFTEGVSLQLMCADQDGIDYYWERLTDGGTESRCGWLEDRFGVSWQVIPTDIDAWLYSGDADANARAFDAMLGMNKIDIETLRAAQASACESDSQLTT